MNPEIETVEIAPPGPLILSPEFAAHQRHDAGSRWFLWLLVVDAYAARLSPKPELN